MANGSVNVSVTEHFKARYKNFPPKSRRKISAFIKEVMEGGFAQLEGRNKFSDDVSTDDPDFLAKVHFVNEHCLWHYHVGIHYYEMDKPHGDRTSMFVLHYKRHDAANISVNHLSPHPPFTLPTLEMFT
ncbi:TPA: hypothetical protein ACM2MD_000067 [Raoultella planticola]|uniref:hypothetical protein n=1 Tax=Raoultella planticola TaxID=575 RepID=UPI00177D598F|nr:hypothetical protein [Raoultella planticola]MBE0016163.1 hypothetical protein [Raoultella planticola]MDV1187671.1 hypothetical protein [Raoultella planticola]